MIDFYKYEGAGNDFIMIDNLNVQFKGNKRELAVRLCNRHFGIGSDGIIFIEKSAEFDFVMDFYNPDGSQSFCGNGSRCAVAFAKYLNCFEGRSATFIAIDGEHHADISGENVKVSMQTVASFEALESDFFIHTGSPHYITYRTAIREIDVLTEGKKIRYAPEYAPNGTNVNFIEEIDDETIALRTYERGVESETLACGTGATAAALSFAVKHSITSGVIKLKAVGGNLKVYFEVVAKGFKNIYLEGPAKFVFKGSINA